MSTDGRTLAVVGAGPGLAMGGARVFGAHGYRVGLVARGAAGLADRVRDLSGLGIRSAAFPADVRDPAALTAALDALAARLGPVDVLEYGPDPRSAGITGALRTTAASATDQFDLIVRGALTAVGHVLPAMLDRGDGALLLTTGASSVVPMPVLGNVGVAMAGLRHWALSVAPELASRGVYVGTVTVATAVGGGDPAGEPDAIGRLCLDMVTRRDRVEEVVGDIGRVWRLVGQRAPSSG
ncbi:short-chain dehydrogenase [Micromonospora wenchangensis]|uniref:Short-chain dehydrogenase n=1 Tax=Micromonospora wenchangensis TaxID=1185415 RepID=A0A246RFE9_9ACTN|nr:SDR family NAD(P)-dependent oxidoreductase [Micromonospora wenchangensis]OWV01489.1 short-chain dehydrogenase [Micromonospora wenchangensis]